MVRTAIGGFFLGVLLAAQPARAQDIYDSGMGEFGLNAGFALPLGNAAGGSGGSSLSDAIKFAVPFGVQVGYRIGGLVFVGANFSYGAFGSPSSSAFPACTTSGVSCHSSFIKVGFSVQWHPLGSRDTDFYVGLGAGYEWLNVSVSALGITESVQDAGFTFGDIPVGVDFRLSQGVRFGPFIDFSLGQYRIGTLSTTGSSDVSGNISPRSIHFWLSFGARITFLGL
jgi:Outer membrane protein beta-barrel domain